MNEAGDPIAVYVLTWSTIALRASHSEWPLAPSIAAAPAVGANKTGQHPVGERNITVAGANLRTPLHSGSASIYNCTSRGSAPYLCCCLFAAETAVMVSTTLVKMLGGPARVFQNNSGRQKGASDYWRHTAWSRMFRHECKRSCPDGSMLGGGSRPTR
jgi:hypothetical protein